VSSNEVAVASACLRWTVAPPARIVSQVREVLATLCRDVLSRDENDLVGMAAHEMLENLVKYSTGGLSSFEIELRRREGDSFIRIQTRNSASEENLGALRRMVDQMVKAPVPGAAYDDLVASSPARSGSGLGLARIRVEADMELACVTEGAIVTLVAERRLSTTRSP
jgi:hypothetical protein